MVVKNSKKVGSVVYVRYRDHVLYHRGDPCLAGPEERECIGWPVYEGPDYIVVSCMHVEGVTCGQCIHYASMRCSKHPEREHLTSVAEYAEDCPEFRPKR